MMSDLSSLLSFWPALGLLIGSALVIAVAGTYLAGVADQLADRTGMGEILAGALFVGGSTSLPGAISSMVTAAEGYAQLSIGNAIGGLTAQTAFLAVADLTYRRANIEHAAATVTGLAQGVLLVTLLTIPLLAGSVPATTLWGIHPATPILLAGYVFGLRLLSRIRQDPMWEPVLTNETRDEVEQPDQRGGRPSTPQLWRRFALCAALTAFAGYTVAESSEALLAHTPLTETSVGTLLTAVANSLPELVTAVAAVRRGAVNLAIGDVIGGNSFEVLFLAAADICYRNGSIYHAFTGQNMFTALIAILMTGVLLLGLLRRQRHGPAGIGFESCLVLVLYAISAAMVLL